MPGLRFITDGNCRRWGKPCIFSTQSAFIMQNLCQSLPLDLTRGYDISQYIALCNELPTRLGGTRATGDAYPCYRLLGTQDT